MWCGFQCLANPDNSLWNNPQVLSVTLKMWCQYFKPKYFLFSSNYVQWDCQYPLTKFYSCIIWSHHYKLQCMIVLAALSLQSTKSLGLFSRNVKYSSQTERLDLIATYQSLCWSKSLTETLEGTESNDRVYSKVVFIHYNLYGFMWKKTLV